MRRRWVLAGCGAVLVACTGSVDERAGDAAPTVVTASPAASPADPSSLAGAVPAIAPPAAAKPTPAAVPWHLAEPVVAFVHSDPRNAFDRPDGLYVADIAGARAHHLSAASAGTPVAWSPDGMRLVLDGGRIVDRRGRDVLAIPNVDWLAWSPDGSRLVATRGTSEGYVVSIHDAPTGRLLKTLPSRAAARDTVAWDPDGLRLALVRRTVPSSSPTPLPQPSSQDGQLVTVGVDGTGERLLVEADVIVGRPVWRAGGTIVFQQWSDTQTATSDERRAALRAVSDERGAATVDLVPSVRSPTGALLASPDASRIAYVAGDGESARRVSVWVYSEPAGVSCVGADDNGYGIAQMAFLPDGRLMYLTNGAGLTTGPVPGGPYVERLRQTCADRPERWGASLGLNRYSVAPMSGTSWPQGSA